MDPFETPHWSKLQAELWICTRSRQAVGLAEHAPGRTRVVETSIGANRVDDEEDLPVFDDEEELIHLVEVERDRRIAAGTNWPTKAAGADELRKWLEDEHRTAPRLTAKTITNRLGRKIPVCPKTPTQN